MEKSKTRLNSPAFAHKLYCGDISQPLSFFTGSASTPVSSYSGDLYGTDPVVEFYAYLSPSKKFDTLDELKACIDHAARRAKAYFAKA